MIDDPEWHHTARNYVSNVVARNGEVTPLLTARAPREQNSEYCIYIIVNGIYTIVQ